MTTTVPNLRDVGGIPTSDGGQVRSGVLLRSALPYGDDRAPDGVVWPPARVVDLRSAPEIGPGHPLEGTGPEMHHVPLLEALRPDGVQSGDPETRRRMREGGLAELYLGMLELAGPDVVRALALVADADGPVLVHCAAGKDRTGVLVALALRCVGVSRHDVVTDYLRTGEAMGDVLARLQHSPRIDPDRPATPAHLALPTDAIEAALDVWDAWPGGATAWVADVGGDPDLVRRLRARLVD
ncbi:tyrosine-protein phosphatase [Solicola sp. PLA-1-18]|uniref:tyrosine-protein phosphatase n=1 Tax=Solicola sp. PLA-1-18 TaxID=3380532 RepID=UPI003B7F52BF